MSGTSLPPLDPATDQLLRSAVRIHARCGRPIDEHPPESRVPGAVCPFPEQPPVEFAAADAEPTIRVVGLPYTALPPSHPVMVALGDLARACRDEFGLGVEVTAEDPDELREALDMLRRALHL